MLKKLIVIPLIAMALSIGSVLITPPSIEANACQYPINNAAGMREYPGYVMSIARPNYDPNVEKVQYALYVLWAYTSDPAYHITNDGYFGFATQTAVLRYQATHGLQRDGQVGPATWNSIASHKN